MTHLERVIRKPVAAQRFPKKHFCHIEPNERYTITRTKASVSVCRNVFALIVDIDDYEGETRLQTKRATYPEIQVWVRRNYGFHVTTLAISWTKDRCGLAKTRHTGRKGPHGPYASELTPEKEAAIRAAFIHFGLIKNE